jgi:hypothetical protein
LFQVEQETNKGRYDGLPEQRAQSGIYVGNYHKTKKQISQIMLNNDFDAVNTIYFYCRVVFKTGIFCS